MTARSRNVLLVLLALAAILPFLPALNAPFLQWDDSLNLADNARWRGFSPANIRWMLTTTFGGPYQPLSWLSYALDFTLWGPNPAAMRLTNGLLHGFSAVLFFLVAEELLREAAPSSSGRERLAAAAFASLFWAVHPLRVESVVWLTERRDVLSGVFYLLAVLLYLRDPGKPLRPLSVYCLAVLSKASVITLPLTLLVLDRWPLRRRAWAEKLPYLAISAAAGIAGLAGQASTGALKGASTGFGQRLALGVHSLWWYAVKTAWPSGLSPYHRVPPGFGLSSPAVWGAAAGVCAAAALAWAARRRAPAAAASAAHYALALLPMAGFARFGHHLVAERYSYLPGLGLSALAGAALLSARRRFPGTAAAAAGLLILALAGLTARRARDWRGDEPLWSRVLALDPETIPARVNLASYLRSAGRVEEALAQERLAVRADPRLAEQWNNLGADALEKKRWTEAETLLRAAVAAKPELAVAHYNLAGALGGQGRRSEELAELVEAARLDSDDPRALNNLGVALRSAGQAARSEAFLRRASELAPDWAAPRENLARLRVDAGNAAARAGRLKEAEGLYRDALLLAPRDESARRNLAEVRRALRGR